MRSPSYEAACHLDECRPLCLVEGGSPDPAEERSPRCGVGSCHLDECRLPSLVEEEAVIRQRRDLRGAGLAPVISTNAG
ncbi:MAG: hypothetical protein ACOCTG_06805, partial [Bacteroidota bacterium]